MSSFSPLAGIVRAATVLCGLSLSAVAPANANHIEITPIRSISDIPATAPDEGHYRVHMIDVGTGLSILVQGHSWNLLYDAGSADDKAGNQATGRTNSRVIAYLYKAIGKSGPSTCVPKGDSWASETLPQLTIDHLVLSHPHDDHGSMMDDVLDCYAVSNMWDSGAINDTVFYDRIIERVAAEQGLAYHTAKAPVQPQTIRVRNDHDLSSTAWTQFSEGDTVRLDAAATFTILHANGHQLADPNENSIVLRLDLGNNSLLLTGDAESGPREVPFATLGDIEEHLVTHFPQQIDVDILQVGHHGSKTSSRAAFVRQVSPTIALVSGGPKLYHTVTLPDQEIIDFLVFEGIQVLRSNVYDQTGCPVDDRVGRDENRPGGCANYVLAW